MGSSAAGMGFGMSRIGTSLCSLIRAGLDGGCSPGECAVLGMEVSLSCRKLLGRASALSHQEPMLQQPREGVLCPKGGIWEVHQSIYQTYNKTRVPRNKAMSMLDRMHFIDSETEV